MSINKTIEVIERMTADTNSSRKVEALDLKGCEITSFAEIIKEKLQSFRDLASLNLN